MKPDTLNQDHIDIEIQNENNIAETPKTPDNLNITTTSVKIEDKDNEKKSKENTDNAHLTNNRKEQKVYGINKQEYWVQFNVSGTHIPEGAGPQLYYEPDRNLFVRIVFAIVLFMLILTAGFVIFVYMTDFKKVFIRYGLFFLIIGVLGMISLNYAMMCSACTRVPPWNFICLFLAVIFMSIIAAYVTARYKTDIIMLALLATTITVAVCLALACTRFDFTKFLLYIIVVAAAFSALVMIIGLTMLVTRTRYKPLTLVILIVGTLINVVVLTMELQMILGGRAVELSEQDYALGAFMLYTSIVDIFLKLVKILGILGED